VFKKLKCKLLGHKWLYNFPSMPSRCLCKRCNLKMEYDFSALIFREVESFPPSLGTDAEIKKRWVH